MKNKKAVSGIVTTVLLILISLVSLAIVWNIVGGIIKTTGEKTDVGVSSMFTGMEIQKVYVSNNGTNLSLTITRTQGEANIPSLTCAVSTDEGSGSFKLEPAPGPLATKIYYLDISMINPSEKREGIRIACAPVFSSGKPGTKEEHTTSGSEPTTPPSGSWPPSSDFVPPTTGVCTESTNCVTLSCTGGEIKENCITYHTDCSKDPGVVKSKIPKKYCIPDDYVSMWKFDDGSGTTAIDSGIGGNTGTIYYTNKTLKILVIGDHPGYDCSYVNQYDEHRYDPVAGGDLVPASFDGINLNDYDIIFWRGDDQADANANDITQLTSFLQQGGGIYVISAGFHMEPHPTQAGKRLEAEDFFPGDIYTSSRGNKFILNENHYVTKGYSGTYGTGCIAWSAGYDALKAGAVALARENGQDYKCCNPISSPCPSGNPCVGNKCTSDPQLPSGDNTYTTLIKEWNNGRVFWDSGCTVNEDMFHKSISWLAKQEPKWTQDKAGNPEKALGFDGDWDYIDVGDIDAFTTQITIGAWIKPVGKQPGYAKIISKRSDTTAYYTYGIQYDLNGNDLFLTLANSGLSTNSVLGINLNKWYHIVATYDGSTAKIYVDGANVPSSNKNGAVTIPSSNNNTIIGATKTIAGNPANFFNGSIDNVMIYNKALSADEIKGIYCSQGGTCP